MCLHIGKRVLARFQASILHVYVNNKNGAVATVAGLVPGFILIYLRSRIPSKGDYSRCPLQVGFLKNQIWWC